NFSQSVYATLQDHLEIMPERFQKMFPYMKLHDWLFNYHHRWGIERSFEGLVRRSSFLTESSTAFEIFNKNYDQLKSYYAKFFPDIKNFTAGQLSNLLHG